MSKLLLYGANGFTGELIARNAKEYGLKPVLSGRSEVKIRPLAEELNLEFVCFELTDEKKIDEILSGFDVVLHAAGPFIHTAEPMIQACLRSRTHYLDLTGEIDVFSTAHSYDEQAKASGIMIMPGVGFDVVTTDVVAKYLSGQMPDATHLEWHSICAKEGCQEEQQNLPLEDWVHQI